MNSISNMDDEIVELVNDVIASVSKQLNFVIIKRFHDRKPKFNRTFKTVQFTIEHELQDNFNLNELSTEMMENIDKSLKICWLDLWTTIVLGLKSIIWMSWTIQYIFHS